MIKLEDLLERLQEAPFRPFRVNMSDGNAYAVRHPDQVMVFSHKLIIGMGGNGSRAFTRDVHCSILHIVSLEDLPAQPGQQAA
jgi:hypothetical protein